ncbi:NAD(P)H-dependent oxidoreductase [Georgenia wutianyii]|uniref:NAD(P)H-dependent oxidoreductase n=1 Tax=Georgenia wutianyii TaxID=2585135 RepID=A0ABX5VJE8_9MICO|nr:NAD(P)H-dependent oxidoreductase [Georgenia wutianyii]QDB78544.1 NAD(P)H-dependent oxidoreductase [Georgenia wutianyii]
MIRLAVLNAATSPHRLGNVVTDWVVTRFGSNKAFAIDRIDLRDVGLPLFDEPDLPRYGHHRHEHTRRWAARIGAADAFVMVSPEYNRGYSALLKNALDYLVHEWAFKPVGIVSYGSGMSGGLVGAEALRGVLGSLQMYPVREMVVVPFVTEQSVREGTLSASEGMVEGIELMMDALVRMDAAMHLLRAPNEELGGQQGSQSGHEGADTRLRQGRPEAPDSWTTTSALERPPGFV